MEGSVEGAVEDSGLLIEGSPRGSSAESVDVGALDVRVMDVGALDVGASGVRACGRARRGAVRLPGHE